MKRVFLTVSFELPPNATKDDAKDYVKDAVICWAGSLRPAGSYNDSDPGDPMFYLKRETVEVKRPRRGGKKK